MTTPRPPAAEAPRRRSYERFVPAGERTSGDFALGLASLPFLGTAIRRRARFILLITAVGLVAGYGVYTLAPPAYKATTMVILSQDPTQNPVDAMQTDVALAQTRRVAVNAMAQLGLTSTETVPKFLGSYTVVAVTDRVLQFTVGGPSSAAAVQRANTLDTVFLAYRQSELDTQQNLVVGALNNEIANYQQLAASLAQQYSSDAGQHASAATLTRVKQDEHSNAQTIAYLQKDVQSYQQTIAMEIHGSGILDAGAAIPRSKIRTIAEYVLAGMLAGLAVGLGMVAIGELASDRLRRRDDVARALGVPVQLSVGLRRRPFRRGAAAAKNRNLYRIAAILRASVPQRRGPVALAVVAVDSSQIPALALLSLAAAKARSGSRVVIADLTVDRAAARLLGVSNPGVRMSTIEGQQVIVAVPEPGDVTPAGPVRPSPPPPRTRPVAPALEAAFESADLMLTLASLDPSVGADHLASWAHGVIVMLTAGQSSATKVLATGELIRLSGAPLISAILLGADKKDDSLGAVPARHRIADGQQAQPAGAVGR